MRNRSAPTATVVPVLIYDDVGQAIEWLCRAFGFTERLRATRDGVVSHAQMAIAEGTIMLGRQGGPYRVPHGNEVTAYVHVAVDDVDGHFSMPRKPGLSSCNHRLICPSACGNTRLGILPVTGGRFPRTSPISRRRTGVHNWRVPTEKAALGIGGNVELSDARTGGDHAIEHVSYYRGPFAGDGWMCPLAKCPARGQQGPGSSVHGSGNAEDWEAFSEIVTDGFTRHRAATAGPDVASRDEFIELQKSFLVRLPTSTSRCNSSSQKETA